jgi:hypothetical protein
MTSAIRNARCMLSTTIVLLSIALPLFGQFTSGSTGSDGALSFPNAKPGDTIIFNPASFNPPLDPAHDNIFNFTTITIPSGVTVKLVSSTLPAGAVVWLATGAVDIEGTLDLSGAAGHIAASTGSFRIPAAAGPGGYTGGVGGNTSTFVAQPGQGPGGGAVGTINTVAGGGSFTGNTFLVPLFGGSGGGGGVRGDAAFHGGGGGGGGAILIASSISITVNGTISANGGNGMNNGGGGSGGAIRLVANTLQGSGHLSAAGGAPSAGSNNGGSNGVVRLEAFTQNCCNSSTSPVTQASPFNTFLPSSLPGTITVTSVGGVAVNPTPTASFQTPDVTINTGNPVVVNIQATNVPLGTVVNLQFYSDNGPDIITTTTALAGSLASSTAAAMVTFPTGFTRGFVFASYTH